MNYLTVADIAKRYSVSQDTVRRWIKAGTLEAINVSTGRRPTYRVSEEALGKLHWMPVAPSEEIVTYRFTKG